MNKEDRKSILILGITFILLLSLVLGIRGFFNTMSKETKMDCSVEIEYTDLTTRSTPKEYWGEYMGNETRPHCFDRRFLPTWCPLPTKIHCATEGNAFSYSALIESIKEMN